MARIYLSSTFADLEDHRREVERVLRKMRHEVRQMEYYTAAPARPLAECLEDVASCDLYVGLFAWRYGYVPPEAGGRSITECELREAEARGIPCLVFVLDEDAPWPASLIDEDRAVIRALRDYLGQTYTWETFRTPDDLAHAVSAAVVNALRDRGPEAEGAGTPAPVDLYETYVVERSKVEADKIRYSSVAAGAIPVLGGGVTVAGLAVGQVTLGLGGLLVASLAVLMLPVLFSARKNKALFDSFARALKRRPPSPLAIQYVERELARHYA